MITGKQVVLRGLEHEDLKLMHKWLNDEEVMEWARSKPDNTASMESVEKDFEQDVKGENPHRRTFIVVEKKTGKTRRVGDDSVVATFQHDRRFGFGDRRETSQRKGLGTETTRLLVDLAFNQHNMHKAELFTRADNKAALRAVTKCGFKEEGRHRDEVYFNGKYYDGISFGLLRDEYETRKK